MRGFADQRLLLKNDPTNPSNRRISIIVRNQGMDAQEEKMASTPPAPAKSAAPEKASAVMLPPPLPPRNRTAAGSFRYE